MAKLVSYTICKPGGEHYTLVFNDGFVMQTTRTDLLAARALTLPPDLYRLYDAVPLERLHGIMEGARTEEELVTRLEAAKLVEIRR